MIIECTFFDCLYTRTAPQKLVLTLSSTASETFDATAVVIGVIPPLNLHSVIAGSQSSPVDVRIVHGTMLSHILNDMHVLVRLARLICILVRASPSTRL